MKAAVCTHYGKPETLQFRDVEKPRPSADEILVRVRATTVTVADVRVRGFRLPLPTLLWLPAKLALGFGRPKNPVLGMELSGDVEEVGDNVRSFEKGDRVFAATLNGFGAYAEYKCLREDGPVAAMPSGLTYEEAAAIPIGARTALFYLREAGIQPGQTVLIYGASGSVGTYAVQIAKYLGATVTAVCSTANVDLVKSLGADEVIDYTVENVSKNGQEYDVVFDTVDKMPFSECEKLLTKNGQYLNCTMPVPGIRMLFSMLSGNRKMLLAKNVPETPESLKVLKDLVEKGVINVVIDRIYPFRELVDAHCYVDQGRKKGNVAITVTNE